MQLQESVETGYENQIRYNAINSISLKKLIINLRIYHLALINKSILK